MNEQQKQALTTLSQLERKELQKFIESGSGRLGVDFMKDKIRQKIWLTLSEKNLIRPFTAHEDFVYYELNFSRPEPEQPKPF